MMKPPGSKTTIDYLVLFDIDGTLLLNGVVARNNFYASFEEVTSVKPRADNVRFHGMTDRGIFHKLLALSGVDGDFETLFSQFAQRFTTRLRSNYAGSDGPHLLPGVREIVTRLYRTPGVALGLGTGNIRETAYIKLDRFNLAEYFATGGFGDEFEARENVIRSAVNAAVHHYGLPSPPDETWVIGDTVMDVRAAHMAGAKVIAVGTGLEPIDILRRTDAEAVLENLADPSLVFKALGITE